MYAVVILMAVVIGVQLALWAKFRNEERGRRIGIGTLQLLLVVAWVVVTDFGPQWLLSVSICALIDIIALSFVPARRKRV